MKPDFSRNISLVSEYQSLERARWSAILSVGPRFITPEVVAAGGDFISEAYRRHGPSLLEILRSKDPNRDIVIAASRAASRVSVVAGREIMVCENGLRKCLSELVILNTGIVKEIASRYSRAAPGISAEEVEQEGFFGIKRAAERFDTTRGNEFSTYAVWWIRAVMKRYVCNHASDVRVPVHRHDKDRSIRKKVDSLLARKNTPLSTREIANTLRESEEEVHDALISSSSRYLSIDAPWRNGSHQDDSRASVHESFRLPDDSDQIEDEESKSEIKEMVGELLRYCELPSRSMRLIELRYGIGSDDADPMTLEQTGQALGLTKERVRQIEKEVIEEIREAAKELRVPYARSGSQRVHPGKKYGAPDVLEYLKQRPGVWLSVEEIQAGIRWMSQRSIAACLRWIDSKGESGVYKDGKKWCYSSTPVVIEPMPKELEPTPRSAFPRKHRRPPQRRVGTR